MTTAGGAADQEGTAVFWIDVVVLAVLIGTVVLFAGHTAAAQEPWAHRLACVAPLSLLVGVVLTVFSS